MRTAVRAPTGGGGGFDTLRLVFTTEEAQDPGVIDEVAAFLAAVEGGGAGRIASINTRFRQFEAVELVAPVVAVNDSFETDEGEGVGGNVLDNDLDLFADAGTLGSNSDALTVSGFEIDTIRAGAILSIAADGTLVVDLAGAYEDLSAGKTETIVARYTVVDDQGFSDEATVTVTITGTDDAAVVTGDVEGAVSEGDPGDVTTATGAIGVSDVDEDDPTLL